MKNYSVIVKKILVFLSLISLVITTNLSVALNTSTPIDNSNTRQMVEELVITKGWDKLLNHGVFIDSYEKLATSSNIYTPEEFLGIINKRLNSIIILSENGWPYQSNDSIYLIPSLIKPSAILHETIHAMSLYYYPFVFQSKVPSSVGGMAASGRLMEGLTDYFAYRAVPELCTSVRDTADIGPIGTVEYWSNICEDIGYPHEYGLSLVFMYAAGSSAVEKAFFDKEEGELFRKNFEYLNGVGKLDKIISSIDELLLYLGYGHDVAQTSDEKEVGFTKTKEYVNDLVLVLENRSSQLSSSEMVKEFCRDLEMFRQYSLIVSDLDFMASIYDRLNNLENFAKGLKDEDFATIIQGQFIHTEVAIVATEPAGVINPAEPLLGRENTRQKTQIFSWQTVILLIVLLSAIAYFALTKLTEGVKVDKN